MELFNLGEFEEGNYLLAIDPEKDSTFYLINNAYSATKIEPLTEREQWLLSYMYGVNEATKKLYNIIYGDK